MSSINTNAPTTKFSNAHSQFDDETLVSQEESNQLLHLESSRSPWCSGLIFAVVAVCLASFSFGFNIVTVGISFIFTEAPSAEGTPIENVFHVSRAYFSLIMSIFAVGALTATLLAAPTADIVGRRRLLAFNNVFYVGGAVLCSIARNREMLLAGRFIIGLGAGTTGAIVPMYLSEVSTVPIRGVLGVLHQLSLVLGIFVSSVLSWAWGTAVMWRRYFACGAVPAVLQLVLLAFAPESPVFYVMRAKADACTAALRRLRPEGWPLLGAELRELHSNAAHVSKAHAASVSVRCLFASVEARRSLLFACCMHAAQQFSGIDVMFVSTADLFAQDGAQMTVAVSAATIAATLASIWCIERVGRRTLTLTSAAGCALSMATLACVLPDAAASPMHASTLQKASVLLFVMCFALGLGPVTWIIINDIFPLPFRAAATSVAVSVNWGAKFVILTVFVPAYDRWGARSLGIFVVTLAAFALLAACLLRETKGRPPAFL